MTVCRLLRDPPADGAWNMAVDEMLLEQTAAGQSGLVWRFYRWTPATLSLGYFQPAAERSLHASSVEYPLVRRLSGGGAIVHDREITYSLIVPGEHRLARDTERLYRKVHDAVVAALCAAAGVAAGDEAVPLVNEHPAGLRAADEPFLCFQRRAVGDVLLAGHKICGSAQRRWRGAILQHGSLLVDVSPASPELPGVQQLAAGIDLGTKFEDRWLAELATRLGLSWQPSDLTAEERQRAQALKAEKFSTAAWNYRR